MKKITKIVLIALTSIVVSGWAAELRAQHVIALTGGAGMATARLYPKQETRPLWGTGTVGFSWRYYSLPRFVGGFGIDVDWMQRGFSYAPYASIYDNKKQFKYYTRRVNTIMVPIVWQPHFYLFKNKLRVYLEAAATFSYNFASTFVNNERYTFGSSMSTDIHQISGKYEMRPERDNRFGFGLAGGGGIDLLFKRFEIGVRARYDFGYSDLMRNRNKYYDNTLDQKTSPGENPFWYTPLRSPLDNLNISIRIGFRLQKEGFKEWDVKKKPRSKEVFKFAL
jgi:hypothetical protein